jgi:hypothetical protein
MLEVHAGSLFPLWEVRVLRAHLEDILPSKAGIRDLLYSVLWAREKSQPGHFVHLSLILNKLVIVQTVEVPHAYQVRKENGHRLAGQSVEVDKCCVDHEEEHEHQIGEMV